MTVREAQVLVAAVVTTLAEVDPPLPVGESILYLGACGGDYENWQTVRHVLVGAGLVEVDAGHGVTLTEKGRALAADINAELAKRGEAVPA